jgi:maleylpyruvate isomerase
VSQRFDPAPDSAEIDTATARFLESARTLSDADVRAPSLLPAWSRGHVLAHVARNADSLVNLLTWAATGVEQAQYPDRGARDAAIDSGAGRGIQEQLADLEAAHERFSSAVAAVPADRWDAEVRWMSGDPRPAQMILDSRLREVAIHHLDLDAGYRASSWSPAFAMRILRSVARPLELRGMAATTLIASDVAVDPVVAVSGGSDVEVVGAAHSLATWLLGRDTGESLECRAGRLPTPPAWT